MVWELPGLRCLRPNNPQRLSELGSLGSRLCDKISCPGCLSGSVPEMDTCGKEDGLGVGKGEVKPWCGPGSLSWPHRELWSWNDDPSELFQLRQKPLGLYIPISVSHWIWLFLNGKAGQQSGAKAVPEGADSWKNDNIPQSWASKSFLEAGSGKCIPVSILEEYLIPWRDAETAMLIFFKSLIKRKEKRLLYPW